MLVPANLIRCQTTLSQTCRCRRILPDSDPPTTPQTSLWPTSEFHENRTRPFCEGVKHIGTIKDTMGMDTFQQCKTTLQYVRSSQYTLTGSGVSPQKGCESSRRFPRSSQQQAIFPGFLYHTEGPGRSDRAYIK